MNELLNRLKTESPDFFKKLRIYAYTVVAIAGIICSVDAVNHQALSMLPQKAIDICYLVGALATGIGVTSHLPTKDSAPKA